MIDPRHLTLLEWTDATNLALATLGSTTVLKDDDWVRWAVNVIALPKVSVFSPPDPRGFPDWKSWAERFVECVLI